MAIRIPGPRKREGGREGGGFSISSHGAAGAAVTSHDGIIVCRDLSPSLPGLSLSRSLPDGIPKFCFSAAINQVSPTVLLLSLGWADSALLLTQSGGGRYVHSSLTSGRG